MKEGRFVPPNGAFTRTVSIRFSHCDPAGIVYFPHYFDMFNGLIEDWYTEQLGGHRFVDTIVTIGTPHHGTYAAYLGFGQAAKDMRPGSDITTTLEGGLRKRKPTYVNLYSDLDFLIVPPSSAVLPDNANVHNHLIEDIGHTSLLLSDELVDQVCGHLEKVERKARMNRLSASA